jgi:hypothetical protein
MDGLYCGSDLFRSCTLGGRRGILRVIGAKRLLLSSKEEEEGGEGSLSTSAAGEEQ